MEYLVSWSIDIEADSPLDAARKAQEIMLDPESLATAFDVRRERGHGSAEPDLWLVDLSDDSVIGCVPATGEDK